MFPPALTISILGAISLNKKEKGPMNVEMSAFGISMMLFVTLLCLVKHVFACEDEDNSAVPMHHSSPPAEVAIHVELQ